MNTNTYMYVGMQVCRHGLWLSVSIGAYDMQVLAKNKNTTFDGLN